MSTEPIPHEMLLRHAGFLRRLARDLVGDPAAAEDAVQEVWLRALEKPPRHGANVRGWLRIVLTNLVRSKARGDSRREARERDRALDSAGEPLGTSPSDEKTLRSVTEAVLALEEPLRTTVLQHYFQGLTTAEIATRDNLPVSTVKSRLQRALEILRVRMKHTSGDGWQASLLALTVPSKIGKGVILMSLKMKLAVGCALLACGVLAYREWSTPAASDPSPVAASDTATSTRAPKDEAPARAPLESDSKPSERIASAETGQSSALPEEPPETSFLGSLRGPDGKLLAGLSLAGVGLTDSAGAELRSDAKQTGSFAFHGLPYGKYWVTAFADGFIGVLDTITLDSSHPRTRRDFTFKPCPTLKIRVTTPEGTSLANVVSDPLQARFASEDDERAPAKPPAVLVPVATLEPPGEWFSELVGNLRTNAAIGRFSKSGASGQTLPKEYLGFLSVDHELPAYVSLVNYQRVLHTQRVRPGADEVSFVLSQADLDASMATVRLQVVDAETLAPLPRALVTLELGRYGEGTKAVDGSGFGTFEGCEPGERDLQVDAKGYEVFGARVHAGSGSVTDLGQLALYRSLEVVLHVVDEAGAPRTARLSVAALDPSNHAVSLSRPHACPVDDAGVLRLAGLGRRLYVIRAGSYDRMGWKVSDEPELLPACTLLDLRSGMPAADLKLTLVPATRVTVVVGGDPGAGLRLRITDEHGIELVPSRPRYPYGPQPFALPPGKYTLALLDSNQNLLKQQPLVVGATPVSVELSR